MERTGAGRRRALGSARRTAVGVGGARGDGVAFARVVLAVENGATAAVLGSVLDAAMAVRGMEGGEGAVVAQVRGRVPLMKLGESRVRIACAAAWGAEPVAAQPGGCMRGLADAGACADVRVSRRARTAGAVA
jgi:hypothetical protein